MLTEMYPDKNNKVYQPGYVHIIIISRAHLHWNISSKNFFDNKVACNVTFEGYVHDAGVDLCSFL